ncbi:MAG: GGDEF domain-containing protein, partial [Pseudomonadales bacterium]|nr:GGDEF domain-containing protein [Pseudomonadales bacterium]
EEFAVIVQSQDLAAAEELAQQLRLAVKDIRIRHENRDISVTASIGMARWHKGDSLDALMHHADMALYKAKNEGRDRLVISTENQPLSV